MKIRVTANDIEHGIRRDPENCPVARALRRAGVNHLGVGGMGVLVGTHREHMMVLLPGVVQDWIAQFDWGKPVDALEFEVVLSNEEKKPPPARAPRQLDFAAPARGMTPVAADVAEPEPEYANSSRCDESAFSGAACAYQR